MIRAEKTVIRDLAVIVKDEVLTIGYGSKIDDFVFIYCGEKTNIGRYCHIAQFVSIIGGGEFEMQDFSALCAGVRIVTGTDRHEGGHLMSASCPNHWRNPKRGKVIIERGAFIGTNSVILPDVTVGEFAVVGAMTLVNRDLEPGGIYVGQPAKRIGIRDAINCNLEKEV